MRIGDEIRASVKYVDGGRQRHRLPVTRENIGDVHVVLDELEELTGIDHMHAIEVKLTVYREGIRLT